MKQYYESELIKEIVEARGHKKSSLHYESECTETWIEEAKGAYPKLCDYQSEWLNYISILDDMGGGEDPEPPIGEFPYVVLSDVTDATIDNVVPYAYKSAILKGNTKYRDIDTGDILDTFDETKNLELVSVKMPVLTTIGENLIGECVNPAERHKKYKAHLKSNTTYTLSYRNSDGSSTSSGRVYLVDGDNEIASYGYGNQRGFTTPATISNETMLVIDSWGADLSILLVEGKLDGAINLDFINKHPYKSNILTVNEPIELRGIADVKDELNCLTGEVTERIGEIVLDGSEDEKWIMRWGESENYIGFQLNTNIPNVKGYSPNQVSNLLPRTDYTALNGKDYEWFVVTNNTFSLKIAKNRLISSNVDGLKHYLSINPLIAQYQLAEKTIKTVDLNIQDQDGKTLSTIKPIEGKMYLSTSSDAIKPLFSGEVPVEAITQNLASFIDLEMEE